MSPEQLREKMLKKIQEEQAKAQKDQDKYEKKQRDKQAKHPDTNDDSDMTVFSKNGVKTIDVDAGFDSKGHKIPQSIKKNSVESSASHTVELGEKKNSTLKDHTLDLERTDLAKNGGKKDIQRSDAPEMMDGDTPKKKGFFERMFSHKKDNSDEFRSAEKGDQVKMGVNSKLSMKDVPPPVAGSHDTVMHRVEAEIARRRLQDESSGKAPKPQAQETDKGEVVELPEKGQPEPAAPPAPPPGPVAAEAVALPPAFEQPPDGLNGSNAGSGAPATHAIAAIEGVHPEPQKGAAAVDPDGTAPATEADIKAAAEWQYKTGLESKDLVAREAAYQRAAVEHRVDAIPYMIEEIHKNGFLSTYVPQYLAGIGKLNDDVEVTLVHGLFSTDAVMRRSCAEALGALKSKRAPQQLMLVMKGEKSYACRSAYAQALGLLGDRTAIPALKAVLEDRSEVEFVRSRAALALAQLGDPAGRAHLITMLDSSLPAMQVMGMAGLAQLRDPEIAGYLNAALESPFDEVWVTAVTLMPSLGPATALPMMRARLESPNEVMCRRGALAMGYLGSDDGVPYIDRAVRVGGLQERVMGCELLAKLQRTDKIPLLIEKLQDAHTLVRQAAAVALVHLHAREALPALVESGRGQRSNFELPPGLRGAQPDAIERLTMLSCVRTLRGEQGDIYLSTLPNAVDHNWPEIDRVLNDQTVELLKMYQLVDVVPDHNMPVGAVLKSPDGKELLVREGEAVAAGFRVKDMFLPTVGKDKQKLPGYVTLMRGEQSVRLIIGHSPEIENAAPTSNK